MEQAVACVAVMSKEWLSELTRDAKWSSVSQGELSISTGDAKGYRAFWTRPKGHMTKRYCVTSSEERLDTWCPNRGVVSSPKIQKSVDIVTVTFVHQVSAEING